jgi:integrase
MAARFSCQRRRLNGKLKAGIDIPTPSGVKALLAAAQDRWRPFLLAKVFIGLRSSELRGLRWDGVDLKASAVHVRQHADKFNVMGDPKSAWRAYRSFATAVIVAKG